MLLEFFSVTRLILASSSPRRREILSYLHIPFTTQSSDVDETPLVGESPQALVARLSNQKARAVADAASADALVLAADTIVVIDNVIIGKPRDTDDARAILERLRGRTHIVYTSITLTLGESRAWSSICETRVHMRDYGNAEIRDYIASRRPFDKAGAYAIQDADFHPVCKIEGCYMNVMGLPLCEVIRGLRALGIAVNKPEPIRHDCLGVNGEPCYADALG